MQVFDQLPNKKLVRRDQKIIVKKDVVILAEVKKVKPDF